jgi:hypothetical protein
MTASRAKKWWTSRTLWVNIGSLVLVAVGLVLDAANVFNFTTQQVTVLTIVVAVINAGLRLITAQPIAGTPVSRGRPPTGPG